MTSSEQGIACTQIATVSLQGRNTRQRHVAETDDQRLVVLETSAAHPEPAVVAGPFTLGQVLEHAELVLAGSPRHITHQQTPMLLAGALIALQAMLRKMEHPSGPGS